jgi:hypothetical protein
MTLAPRLSDHPRRWLRRARTLCRLPRKGAPGWQRPCDGRPVAATVRRSARRTFTSSSAHLTNVRATTRRHRFPDSESHDNTLSPALIRSMDFWPSAVTILVPAGKHCVAALAAAKGCEGETGPFPWLGGRPKCSVIPCDPLGPRAALVHRSMLHPLQQRARMRPHHSRRQLRYSR